ncbi:MAG TPA: hypothetical protein DCM05_00725 [Elusimicrobia bacterium]|nr:hypothetical protein [Elusimicrobiota bacterium]
MNTLKRAVGRRSLGQIAIPSLLVFPSLFLIIVLLIQVNRLSREKIRQQFSIDSASTIEAEQYTDLLNRMAYINGIFPQRIFQDAYGAAWGYFYALGMFPGTQQGVSPDAKNWGIQYGPGRASQNTRDPAVNMGYLVMAPPSNVLPTADDISQVSVDYISVYRWLGKVASAQKAVFERMTAAEHPLARKALWVNLTQAEDSGCPSGSPTDCYEETTSPYPYLTIRHHYIQGYIAACHCPNRGICPVHFGGDTYSGNVHGAFTYTGPALFQLQTIPSSEQKRLSQGWDVKHSWVPPRNAYDVDFSQVMAEQPYVRSHVSVEGGEIWPNPMPRYRTKLNP